jgi:hypothetical protein
MYRWRFSADGSHSSLGLYTGSMDIAKTSLSMTHIIRSFIKLSEEQGLTLEQSLASLNFSIKKAVEMEKKNVPEDSQDYTEHLIKMRYDKELKKKKDA